MLARKIVGGTALAIVLLASVAAAQTSTTSTSTSATTTPTTTTTVTPTAPNTGAGGDVAMNIAVLGVSAALALGGAYIARSRSRAA